MPGSLTSGFLWSRWRGKRSRHSRRMRSPQFYVSGKRPMPAASEWTAVDKSKPIAIFHTKCAYRLVNRGPGLVPLSSLQWHLYASCYSGSCYGESPLHQYFLVDVCDACIYLYGCILEATVQLFRCPSSARALSSDADLTQTTKSWTMCIVLGMYYKYCHVIYVMSPQVRCTHPQHDDVIKWKHFPHYWPFVWGIHRPLVNSPHKDQWTNGWVNNRDAGDLRRHRAHYDVIVMNTIMSTHWSLGDVVLRCI